MPMSQEPETGAPPLAGTKGNPAHEPKKKLQDGKGTIGDKALMDAVILVIACWVLLFLLWYSLRHHNV